MIAAAPVPARRFVLLAALVGGTCDIVYALLYYGWKGVPALRLLQSIASGLLGQDAFAGGFNAALLGLALHYAILLVAAALFLEASRRLAWLRAHAVAAGALFGLAIYGVMNLVVLPLSAYPFPLRFPLATTVTGVLVHMFLIGVPISLLTRRAMAAGA